MPKEGYHFKEWQVISGGVAIENNKFLMPDSNVEVNAVFEKDAPPAPTDPASPASASPELHLQWLRAYRNRERL